MVQAKSCLVICESCSDFPIGILRTFPRIIDQSNSSIKTKYTMTKGARSRQWLPCA
jgi:hypothetical protein